MDSTFYRTRSASIVSGWYVKSPSRFAFALMLPKVITHERYLLDCEAEFDELVACASLLNGKLGPVLNQFPYTVSHGQALVHGVSDRVEDGGIA